MLDPTGLVATWNVGAERIKGYAADEIIGQHFSRFYEQHDIDAGKCETRAGDRGARGPLRGRGLAAAQGRHRFWANVVITALRNPDGELVGFAQGDARPDRAPQPGAGAAAAGARGGGHPAARRVPVAGVARAEDAAHGPAAPARYAAGAHGRVGRQAGDQAAARVAEQRAAGQPGREPARRIAHRDGPVRAGPRAVRSGRKRSVIVEALRPAAALAGSELSLDAEHPSSARGIRCGSSRC